MTLELESYLYRGFLHTLRTLEALAINMFYNTVRETYTNFKCAPSLLFNSSIHCSALWWTHYHHCQSPEPQHMIRPPSPTKSQHLENRFGNSMERCSVHMEQTHTHVLPSICDAKNDCMIFFFLVVVLFYTHKRDTWEHTSWRYNAQRLNFYGVSTLNAKKSTCSRQGHHTRM